MNEFSIINYRIFCIDYDLKLDRLESLKLFKRWCNKDYSVIMDLLND